MRPNEAVENMALILLSCSNKYNAQDHGALQTYRYESEAFAGGVGRTARTGKFRARGAPFGRLARPFAL